MKRDGEFDHAEAGAEVSTSNRDGVNHLRAQLVGELTQIAFGETAEIVRRFDGVEEGRLAHGEAINSHSALAFIGSMRGG
jgi:hypothetical protein